MPAKKKRPPPRKPAPVSTIEQEPHPLWPQPAPPKPAHDFPTEEYDPFLLADDLDWLVLEPAFIGEGGEMRAQGCAELLAILVCAIESGPETTARAVHTLKDGIRICHRYTRANRMALQLFFLSAIGEAKDDPLFLLGDALKRASAKRWDD